MAFTDRARIHVEGGHGGAGCMSFRREAHVPKGGPDGGNGGRGGDVVLVADPQVTDLSRFRTAVHHRAPAGAAGQGRKKHGRAGAALEIAVPPGTRVLRDGAAIATLDVAGERVTVAQGGGGGVGNRAFRSSTHRTPRETVPGTPGEEAWLTLEFRLPADVVLVGLPNSGKSALLRALTGASAMVAPYPHSTTEPALGPLEDEASRLWLVADLPGLAADGAPRKGHHLGQLERARVVVHCVDATDAEPAEERIARVRAGIAPFRREGIPEVVVATRSAGDVPPWAAAGVDSVDGAGVEGLRRRIMALLDEAA